MSQEKVQRALALMEALSSRDAEALTALADAEVEWHSFFAVGQEGGVYRGHEGTRQYLSDLGDAWETVRAGVDDVLVVGDVAVLVGHLHYRGQESRIETETPAGWTLKFRGEKLLRFRAFRDPERALEAVGA
jgi:ketosteroid isomerase-like protein